MKISFRMRKSSWVPRFKVSLPFFLGGGVYKSAFYKAIGNANSVERMKLMITLVFKAITR
jgi:hypothetical protein